MFQKEALVHDLLIVFYTLRKDFHTFTVQIVFHVQDAPCAR